MNDWPKVRLGEIISAVDRAEAPILGKNYRQIGVKLWGVGAYERKALDGGSTKYAKLFRVEADDIIVNKIWARNGSVAVVPEALTGCYGSAEFPMFEPKRDQLEPRWIHWITKTRSFWEQCDEKSQGTSGKNRIRPERFLDIEIPLPPLAEQRRIVARIEELAAHIHEARMLRQRADEESNTLGKAAGQSFFAIAAHKFGSLRLGEIATKITKGESPEWQGFSYQETGPQFIRSENVLWGRLDLTHPIHISEMFHRKLSRSQVIAGDVLINLVGASIGRSCVVPDGIGEANVNQAVAVITPHKEILESGFLAYFLISPSAQDKIHGGKVETARPNISLGDLRNLKIPVPSLSEQRRIVAELDVLQAEVDKIKLLQFETAAEIDALLPAILDRALKGEL